MQTHFNKRNENSTNKVRELKILKLLKSWKEGNQSPLKSYHLKLLVQQSFNNLPHRNIDKLIMSAEYIKETIHKRIIAPGNSNNIISETISDSEKKAVVQSIDSLLADYQKSPLSLQNYFQQL